MPKCHLHLGTHKTGTTSIQAYAYKNRDRLLEDGLLYPGYTPVYTQKKAITSHHRFARAVVHLDPHLKRSDAEQLVDRWASLCNQRGVALFLSAENMSTLEDKQYPGDKRGGYWIALRDLLDGFDVQPSLVLRRQEEYIESFYKERVRNIFGYRPVSLEEYFSAQVARGGMVCYRRSIESITEVFGRVATLNFHDLSGKNLAADYLDTAFGLDSTGYERVGNERPSLSSVATAVKVEVSEFISDQHANRLFVEWLLSAGFEAAAGNFLDTSARTCLFKSRDSQQRVIDHFVSENAQLSSAHGIHFPEVGDADLKEPLPAVPTELIEYSKGVLASLRGVKPASRG